MSVAQQLYEGVEIEGLGATALVTYIRTDSVRVSEEAEQEARTYIKDKFGADYLPKAPRQFKNRNKAQDAHEAIRPAHFDLPPQQIKAQISHDQFRLYQLIWDKFMASQMAAAQIDTVVADLVSGDTHLFRVSGETVRFPGYLAQYGVALVDSEPEKESEEESREKLPELAEGETLLLKGGSKQIPVYMTAPHNGELFVRCTTPFLSADLSGAVGISTGRPRTVEEIEAVIKRQQEKWAAKQGRRYGQDSTRRALQPLVQ
ncbi:MAG: DNA topoisomerase, partial [Clostridiales bacterium]|nr:DNA topoisomerase [Clostridiales bacterium]